MIGVIHQFKKLTQSKQLYYLNRGVQLCDTMILVPLNFCSFNVSCLFNGLVYFNQWDALYWYQVMAVLFGIVILVLGVLVISLQPSLSRDDISIASDYSQPFLKTTSTVSSLDDGYHHYKKPTRWWTRMKLIYRKKSTHSTMPDEHTGLLTSI
jgi:hypothetical protein